MNASHSGCLSTTDRVDNLLVNGRYLLLWKRFIIKTMKMQFFFYSILFLPSSSSTINGNNSEIITKVLLPVPPNAQFAHAHSTRQRFFFVFAVHPLQFH